MRAVGAQRTVPDRGGIRAADPLRDDVADLARRIYDSRPQVVPFADVAFRLRQAGYGPVTIEQVRNAVLR